MATVVLLAEGSKGIHASHARGTCRRSKLLGGNCRQDAPEIALISYHVSAQHIRQARIRPKHLPRRWLPPGQVKLSSRLKQLQCSVNIFVINAKVKGRATTERW